MHVKVTNPKIKYQRKFIVDSNVWLDGEECLITEAFSKEDNDGLMDYLQTLEELKSGNPENKKISDTVPSSVVDYSVEYYDILGKCFQVEVSK